MFPWDAREALKNYQKHDVPFEEASTVFGDPDALDWEDLEHPAEERRWMRLGLFTGGRVLLVVYTFRRFENGIETVRIISARQASRRERQAHAR